jgi:hypothetical protein
VDGRVDRTFLAHGTAANDGLEEPEARACLSGRFERVKSEDVANQRGGQAEHLRMLCESV